MREFVAELEPEDFEEYRRKQAEISAMEVNPYDKTYEQSVELLKNFWCFQEYIWNKYCNHVPSNAWHVDLIDGCVYEIDI